MFAVFAAWSPVGYGVVTFASNGTSTVDTTTQRRRE